MGVLPRGGMGFHTAYTLLFQYVATAVWSLYNVNNFALFAEGIGQSKWDFSYLHHHPNSRTTSHHDPSYMEVLLNLTDFDCDFPFPHQYFFAFSPHNLPVARSASTDFIWLVSCFHLMHLLFVWLFFIWMFVEVVISIGDIDMNLFRTKVWWWGDVWSLKWSALIVWDFCGSLLPWLRYIVYLDHPCSCGSPCNQTNDQILR